MFLNTEAICLVSELIRYRSRNLGGLIGMKLYSRQIIIKIKNEFL